MQIHRTRAPKQLLMHLCTRFLLCTTNVANTQQTFFFTRYLFFIAPLESVTITVYSVVDFCQ